MSDMTDAREEIEQRLNFLLPQAERMLNERGDFYPYAAALDRAGTIDAVAAPITGADSDVSDVLVALHEELRAAGR